VDLAKIAPRDWIFHFSLAYCSSLSAVSWTDVSHSVDNLIAPEAQTVLSEVEIVAFDNQQESSGGVIALGG